MMKCLCRLLKRALMKKILSVVAVVFLLVALVLTNGCCHTQVFTEPAFASLKKQTLDNQQPVAVGRATSTGYYLFNTWPLYTGNPENYNRKDYHSFYDDLNFTTTSSVLLKEMRRRYGAEKLVNVSNSESSWGWFSLWIVWRRVVTTNAVGVKTISK